MKKFAFSVSAAWVLGILAFGSLHARNYDSDCETPAVEGRMDAPLPFFLSQKHSYSGKSECMPPPPPFNPNPAAKISASPWNPPSKEFFPVEKAMALDTPPALPAAPQFKDLDQKIQDLGSMSDTEAGSVLELWFRKEGVSEKDLKTLNQLPSDQKALIRKIVQVYQIDMQRTVLEMRPNYQRIRNDMDVLKLELSRLILVSGSSPAESKEIKAVLDEIALKEAELVSLQGIQDKINSVFKKEMTDQIAEVVNAWIAVQASKTKESLSDLFMDAEESYGLKWE